MRRSGDFMGTAPVRAAAAMFSSIRLTPTSQPVAIRLLEMRGGDHGQSINDI